MIDLLKPHMIEDEMPYKIMKTIRLLRIDYENFATDLTVERKFISQFAHLCGIQNGIWRCLLIQQKIGSDGILVMPAQDCRVGYAAYCGHSLPRIPR